MLSLKQVEQLKKHSKEAVESLPEDHPWVHFLGSLDMLCDTALELYASQPSNLADSKNPSEDIMPLKDLIKMIPSDYYVCQKTLWVGDISVDIDNIVGGADGILDYKKAFKDMLIKLKD